MTRILVTREDGSVIWNEGVNAADFETQHFRLALADRLGWAVADADRAVVSPSFSAMEATRPAKRSSVPEPEPSSVPEPEPSRAPERVLAGAL